jgi:hypothetical protein
MSAVKQLAGRGVEGMEEESPLYHFDLSMEELNELITNPEGFLGNLGVPVSAARTILLSRWNEAYSPSDGWQASVDSATDNPRACCTTGDGGMTCTKWRAD